MTPPDDKVRCPHCGEWNIRGSNLCGRCLRDIRSIANPEREDSIETAKTSRKVARKTLWKRIKRWWKRRKRRAG